MSDDVWFLKQVDWLAELDEAEWQKLRERARRHEFAVGATVFAPARDPRSIYLLERGRIRIYRLSDGGDELTLGYVGPGEVFGELAGFGDYPRESFAVAQIASSAWKIPVEVFRALLTARPQLVIEVTRQIGDRMKRVEARVESLVFRNVRSRLALALLELAEDIGRREGSVWIVESFLTQSELAKLIGSSRQSVSSAMTRLREEALVQQQDGRLVLLRPDALRELADSRTAATHAAPPRRRAPRSD